VEGFCFDYASFSSLFENMLLPLAQPKNAHSLSGDLQLNNSISKQGKFANSSDCNRPDVAQRPTNLVLIACQGKESCFHIYKHTHTIYAYMHLRAGN